MRKKIMKSKRHTAPTLKLVMGNDYLKIIDYIFLKDL